MGVATTLVADDIPRRTSAVGKSLLPEELGPVCVTSGESYLGSALVRLLLRRGYLVKVTVNSQAEQERMREEERRVCAEGAVVVVDEMDVLSLCEAFDGCVAVFHTSCFADPKGLSGYTKMMANMEAAAAENVVEACARVQSVRNCVFTSSLLACVWRKDHSRRIVDERCWSDEDLCRDKKLWFALGKTMAERSAWMCSQGKDMKLATVCPGLIVGPEFHVLNTTASIAYLKDGRQMYKLNTLATTDVDRVTEAHLRVYEAMTAGTAGGRYLCFDRVIGTDDEAEELEKKLGLPRRISSNDNMDDEVEPRLVLANKKMSTLESRMMRCLYDARYSTLD